MYYAWPVKAHIFNEFTLSQTLKKSSVATSKIGEGNKVEKKSKNKSPDFICLKKSWYTWHKCHRYFKGEIQTIHCKILSQKAQKAKIMKIFLHLSNKSGQWQHLQIENIFSSRQFLIKVEITLVFGFAYYAYVKM